MFFQNQVSSLELILYDRKNISPPSMQLSQLAFIDFFPPLPLFPIKNGMIFLLAA